MALRDQASPEGSVEEQGRPRGQEREDRLLPAQVGSLRWHQSVTCLMTWVSMT